MEVKEMSMSDIETRSLEIEEELVKDDADIESLTAEVQQLEERKIEIEKEAEDREKIIEEVISEKTEIEEIEKEEVRTKMQIKELRNFINRISKNA